jgi:hypothetical protein
MLIQTNLTNITGIYLNLSMLQNCLSSTNPSIDTFLHLYGSEIWGMFSVDSSSCRKKSDYCFENFFSTSLTEQSHVKIVSILGFVEDKQFCNLKYAFIDFLYRSSLH